MFRLLLEEHALIKAIAFEKDSWATVENVGKRDIFHQYYLISFKLYMHFGIYNIYI